MTRTFSLYLKCQLGGWLLYGLIRLLGGFLITPQGAFSYGSIVMSVLIGLIATHALRELIRRFGLRPPLPFYKWAVLGVMILGTVVFYALINSMMIKWLNIYTPSRMSAGTRFLANIILDSPIILVWVGFYYLWHFIDRGTVIDQKITELEKLVRQMKQELGFSEP